MNKIKYFIVATAMLLANSAIANTVQLDAVVVKVVPTYTEVQVNTPWRSCEYVDVPIYGKKGGGSTGDVLGGAIIGGILGNQVGGGSGKDAATILGAILGADIANKKSGKNVIVGYKKVEQCETVNQITTKPGPTIYDVTVNIPGMDTQHTFRTNTKYTQGETIFLRVNYNVTKEYK
jgi:uncharacterized protein YcfJ